jgi:hypothetical protein
LNSASIRLAYAALLIVTPLCGSAADEDVVTPARAAQKAGECGPLNLRGVFFNPQPRDDPDFPWLLFYPDCRAAVRAEIAGLVEATGVNMVTVYVLIAYSLNRPSDAIQSEQPFSDWANTAYLDNVALFVDDCNAVGLSVELDLASNLWVPYSADAKRQIGHSEHWPMPDETPWDEAAAWYCGVIKYVERKATHPENIALWVMTGNYQLGAAEPCLWPDDTNPEILEGTERLVKYVWPRFRATGKRPKAAPYTFPIFSNAPYWMKKSPEERMAGLINLKKWLVDDLALPPDYWPISAYPLCDPAPDGVHYLRRIVEILGPEQASRILYTDLKAIGIDFSDTILSTEGRSSAELLAWHFQKFDDYEFAGWWIWEFRDTAHAQDGIRDKMGAWKEAVVKVMEKRE